ncbi:single-stranded DNA-binding protein [Marinactinospora thermotolerans]|uniref:single-stranded DNA-binding protein n=1 Tax=Marinactinospora thermotolerans TaxID=531310 RepID=UPI003D8B203E
MHKTSTASVAVHRGPAADPARVPSASPTDDLGERAGADRLGHRNEVLLAGRVTAEPAVRELPSGDHLVTWRVSVVRPPQEQRPNQPADPITCVSFHPSMEEATRGWRIGDLVQVTGALRRRFWRSPSGAASVFEVEARTARRIEPPGSPAQLG